MFCYNDASLTCLMPFLQNCLTRLRSGRLLKQSTGWYNEDEHLLLALKEMMQRASQDANRISALEQLLSESDHKVK